MQKEVDCNYCLKAVIKHPEEAACEGRLLFGIIRIINYNVLHAEGMSLQVNRIFR